MHVTMRAEGRTVEEICAIQIRDMRVASRKLGTKVKNAAVKAVRESARAQLGGLRFGKDLHRGGKYRLNVKGKTDARAELVSVDVYGTPVGYWSILESGRKGGYTVKPRVKKALSWNGETAASKGHRIDRSVAGTHVWSNTEKPLRAAIEPVIEAGYAGALDGR